jgi:hypothetical protein
MAGETPEKSDDVAGHVGYYVVCVLDLLGQAEALKVWSHLPQTDEERKPFIDGIKNSLGTVEVLRENFLIFFDTVAQRTIPDNLFAQWTHEQREAYTRARNCELKVAQFSDTFVFYAPLRNRHGDVTVEPMYRSLAACAMAMLVCLSSHIPIRGAVCIGTGMEATPGNFYGPSLAVAHHLESRIAEYPRVIASGEIAAFLTCNGSFSNDPTINQIMSQFGPTCRTFLCQDVDGEWIVDFAGAAIRKLYGEDEHHGADPVREAYRFAVGERDKFRQERDHKLAWRYSHLVQYLESRLPIWALSPEEVGNGG